MRRYVRRWRAFRDRRRSLSAARAESRERARWEWCERHGISQDILKACEHGGEETMRQVYVPLPRWRRGRRGCGHCVACCGVPFEMHWKAALSAAQWARERVRRAAALKDYGRSSVKVHAQAPTPPIERGPSICELLGQAAPNVFQLSPVSPSEPGTPSEGAEVSPGGSPGATHRLAPASPPHSRGELRFRRRISALNVSLPPKATNIPPRLRTLVILAENAPPMQPASDTPPSLARLSGSGGSRTLAGDTLHRKSWARGEGRKQSRSWGKWFRSLVVYK